MKYFICTNNQVITETQGTPTNMDGVITINLPANNGMLTVISRGKEYPDYKVALAVARGQIKIEDIKEGVIA